MIPLQIFIFIMCFLTQVRFPLKHTLRWSFICRWSSKERVNGSRRKQKKKQIAMQAQQFWANPWKALKLNGPLVFIVLFCVLFRIQQRCPELYIMPRWITRCAFSIEGLGIDRFLQLRPWYALKGLKLKPVSGSTPSTWCNRCLHWRRIW